MCRRALPIFIVSLAACGTELECPLPLVRSGDVCIEALSDGAAPNPIVADAGVPQPDARLDGAPDDTGDRRLVVMSETGCFDGCASTSPCDPTRARCVACLDDADCQTHGWVCDPVHAVCVECNSDEDCAVACDPVGHRCLECEANADCPVDSPACRGGRCFDCLSDADCADRDQTPYCGDNGSCVACRSDAHCNAPDAAACVEGECAPCVTDLHCLGTGLPVCKAGGCEACTPRECPSTCATPFRYYRDADEDGLGDAHAQPKESCAVEPGYVLNNFDCSDTCPACRDSSYPEQDCDGYDNDCDGAIDEGLTVELYRDQDGDGYGGEPLGQGCALTQSGVATGAGDCAPEDHLAFPRSSARASVPVRGVGGFDYDCDGEQRPAFSVPSELSVSDIESARRHCALCRPGSTRLGPFIIGAPSCGATTTVYHCEPSPTGRCAAIFYEPVRLECH